ncbi:unnamed protein product [Rotaria socialis]
MSRNNRKNIDPRGGKQARDDQRRISAAAGASSTTGSVTYDESFPPLLPTPSTSGMSGNPARSIQDRRPSTAEESRQQQSVAQSVDDSTRASAVKRPGPWKSLAGQPKTLALQDFMLEPTKGKVVNINKTYSADGSTSNNVRTQSDVRPKSKLEEDVNTKLCEIILTIHLRKEFVSLQRVEQELFAFYEKNSFRELGVHPHHLNAIRNLVHYNKDVTFYMQVFKEVFNLCTLHDLGQLLAKFLKVDTYEDAHIGPLDEHPDVKRIFNYKPTKRHQPIPAITSADIVNSYLEFQDLNRGRQFPYEKFLDNLVEKYQLQKREELGIYCKSFPYLTEVTTKMTREYTLYKRRTDADVRQQMISLFQTKLWEIKQEVENELELSAYATKSPVAVIDHLSSIVEKYLTVPEQKNILDIMIKIRNDELLRCLLNVSIYLGTIDKPDKFLADLQKLYQSQGASLGRQNVALPSVNTNRDGDHPLKSSKQRKSIESSVASHTTIDTSFEASFMPSDSKRPKISLKQICTDLTKLLERYDTMLSIKQLFDVEKRLCNQHSVKRFSDFGINDDDDDDDDNIPLDLISFLYAYREKIDPNGELSIYESSSSAGDRQEMYSFVNQLIVLNDRKEEEQEQHCVNKREIHMTKDQLSAIEKAVKHKFGGLLGFNRPSQILSRTKQKPNKMMHPIIHFEESLLDVTALNRLGICPSSLLVDETQLCQIILQCPIMVDLFAWLQWSTFFQPRYGSLKTFIVRKEYEFNQLLLLELSNHELLRLPSDFSLDNFEKELEKNNICSAVGHLCALITREYVQVNRIPLTIYRQVITTWLIRLRSAAQLKSDSIEPMQYVLEFISYLPALIGQTRIVQDLVLESLDDVFGNDDEHRMMNARQTIWKLANAEQRNKLEMWGYILDLNEWKNQNKWKGINEPQEEFAHQKLDEEIQTKVITRQDNLFAPTKIETTLILTPPPITATSSTTISIDKSNIDENDPASVAFDHIKKIREGFGVDSSLDAAGQSIVTNLQGMIERSLEKLSNDLYSEQGHFVLELIQNADDNQYAPDRLPTLRFILCSERILVCNNEIGFQSNHISAICNVGKSTKGKHKQGYAGHKGIGFKSVFMVSHRPEIHSGHYHFCFDTVNGTKQIGYIRPIWLEKYDEALPSVEEWATCIRLPIKQEKRGDRLKRNFDDIQARLLLFLNRLRQIEIVRQQGKNEMNSRVFTRVDHARGQIIELQERTTNSEKIIKNFWLVVKKVIQVPADVKMKLSDVKCDVESTTIAIAYPLNPIFESSSHQISSTQPLFAYLPLRSYGFRFILQADFEIPATRQEVLRDNMWNEWLKTEMIQLLPLAYEQFQHLPDLLISCSLDLQQNNQLLTSIQTLKYFLKLIPTRNEIDPYFNTFIDKSIQLLMGIIQLPVLRNEILEWVSPTRCVVVRDAFIREIFSQDLLLSHFNSYYLDEQIVTECDEAILMRLGCQRLDFSSILRLIRTLYTQNEQEHSTKTTSIEQIAQWLLCIDYSLQQEREKPGFNFDHDDGSGVTTMEELKKMKIIPLQHQSRLVSIEEFSQRAILFPLNKKTPYAKYLKIVLEDTPMIDERLLDFIESKYPRRFDSIKRLLKDLGITDALNIRRIYSNHILPVMMDDAQWSKKSDSVLIAYLMCIYKDLYAPRPDLFIQQMDELKNQMIVKTRQGKFVRIDSNGANIIHLTSLYGCERSLDSLTALADQFTFISDDYFKEYRTELFLKDSDRNLFIHFLNDLNIHDFFLVKTIEHPFIKVEQLVGTQWAHEIATLSSLIYEPFFITDYCCDEFDALVSSKDNLDAARYTPILLYFDRHFESISAYFVASVIRARSRHTLGIGPVKGIESSFYSLLRKHPWIPVGSQFLKPTDVYFLPLNHPFSRYVPHLDRSKIPLKNTNLIRLLGFQQEITRMTMFEFFMKWSCDLDRDSLGKLMHMTLNVIPCTIPTTFRQSCRDTIDNIRHIYLFLASDSDTCARLVRFRLWPLIFIPRTVNTGDFLFIDEVFWRDSEALLTRENMRNFESIRSTPIQPYYGNDANLQKFFVDVLQVKCEPTLDDYLPLLFDITDKTNEFIWKCIEVITRLAFAQNKQTTVKDKCLDWAFIPCLGNQNKLFKYTEQLYYPHDMNIADIFADTLLIVKLPDVLFCSAEFKQRFCSLFNINNLADVIKVLVNVDNEQTSTDLLDFYACSIDFIQHFLLSNNFISESRSCYLQSIFSSVQFVSVDYIRLSYCYQESIVRAASSSSSLDSYMNESVKKFYILKKYEKFESYHINTMVNYLVSDESARLKLSQYITYLFKVYKAEDIEGLAKQRDLLPEKSQHTWIIPELIKNESDSSLSEEENAESNESIDIPFEMLEKMRNQPGWQPPKPAINTTIDPNKPKSLTCFPMKAGKDSTIESSNQELQQKSQLQSIEAMISNLLVSSPNNPTESMSSVPKPRDDCEQTSKKKNDDQLVSQDSDKRPNVQEQSKSNTNDPSPSDRLAKSCSTSFSLADFSVTPPPTNFEHIRVATLKNFVLSSVSSPNILPPPMGTSAGNEVDSKFGRRGEEFVYRYLEWKHPKKTIEWVNQQQESGKPFDIRIIDTTANNKIELIEVKTSRSSNQNTFQISINEIECLLANQTNYHIYRLYYPDDENSSTITILSQLKVRLQQKQLVLSMTLIDKNDE